jgi:hypothetical protein
MRIEMLSRAAAAAQSVWELGASRSVVEVHSSYIDLILPSDVSN